MSLPWSAPSPVAPSTPDYAMHVPRRPRSLVHTVLGAILIGTVLVGGFIWFGTGTQDPSRFGDLRVGMCLTKVPSGRVTSIHVVDCAEPHTVEIFSSGAFDEFSSASADEQASARCIGAMTAEQRRQLIDAGAEISFVGQGRKAGKFFCLATFDSQRGSLDDGPAAT